MKTIIAPLNKPYLLVALLLVFAASCSDDDAQEVELFTPGALEASADRSNIMAGESVTFIDNSTKAFTRTWTFNGGEPSTSTEPEVTVTYPQGGSYEATLSVTFVDNQVATTKFPIEVEAGEEEEEEEIIATYAIFTEDPDIEAGAEIMFAIYNGFTSEIINDDPYEGEEARVIKDNGTGAWAMGAISPVEVTDISEYADGKYNVAMKSTSEGVLQIRLSNSGDQYGVLELAPGDYGFARDGEWHMLSIPISDFLANNPDLDLTSIKDFMVFRSVGDVLSYNNYEFHLDHFYLSR